MLVNKTKRQLYQENKILRDKMKMVEDFLYKENDEVTLDKILKMSKSMKLLTKIVIFIAILLLCLTFLIFGMCL